MDATSMWSTHSMTFKVMPVLVVESSTKCKKLFFNERIKLQPLSCTFLSTFSSLDLARRLFSLYYAPQLTSKGGGPLGRATSHHVRSKIDHLNPSLVDSEVEREPVLSLTAGMEMKQSDIDVKGFNSNFPSTLDISAHGTATGETAESGAELSTVSQRSYRPKVIWFAKSENEEVQFIDRGINASIAGAAGVFAIAKVLTVDQDYWHGWTIFEILKYAPIHNWSAYEDALKSNPVLAKMMISGVVYSVGDWIAQCYEGKPILDFNRVRMVRSGCVGFCLHGSLSHFYYQLCEAGWKLWPFAHVITYGVVPVEQRLLWVDCVELLWVTILSMYSNEKAEKRKLEAAEEAGHAMVKFSDSEGTSSEDANK